jgi:uncharacterized protein YbjT (DUF2867 family)
MNVVIFGATGMVGAGVLLECFADPRVTSVLAITRSPTGRTHSKLHEVVHQDFFDFESLRADFASCDACFFCLGITSLGLSEAAYTRVTYDIAMAAAREMVAANPLMTFCFVSGVGTDSTERGRTMWARVKGKTENALLALGFKAAYMFRPGYIQPIGDVQSKTGWVQTTYDIARPLYPLINRLLPNNSTTTSNLGRAMIQVAAMGYSKQVLYSSDFNTLAAMRRP